MGKIETPRIAPFEGGSEKSESRFFALGSNREGEILSKFSPEEQKVIRERQKVLSSLALFIGKDFTMPVELNEPGQGWYWDFEKNIVRIDPIDLLEKPMEYLRFVISHEGGHRRVSRTDFIPLELWNQLGFSFLMNAIEDPRTNNFVAESYPRFSGQMSIVYEHDLDIEKKAKNSSEEKLGYQPKFIQAGFEYIAQWFREIKGEEQRSSESLPEDVQDAVVKTLSAAQTAWYRYPSRVEADASEDLIKRYAKSAFETIRDHVWPQYQKLIEQDLKSQEVQELLKEMQEKASSEGAKGLPENLEKSLSEGEKQELKDALEKAIEKAIDAADEKKTGGVAMPVENGEKKEVVSMAIPLDSLSDALKEKIRQFIDSLPEDELQEIKRKAKEALTEVEKEISDELEGKLSENLEQTADQEKQDEQNESQGGTPVRTGILPREPIDTENLRTYRERVSRELNKDENAYEKYRREVLPLIETLEAALRQIFIDSKTTSWKRGFKSGKRIDITKRIQEKAREVPAMESKSWQKRERPDEKDYAISLLVDLSGSMRENRKIEETFKAIIVLAEVLNKLGIDLEIIGFNDDVYEYQNFGQPMSRQIREHMGGMFKEVDDSCCKGCGNEHSETDLGWATEVAAKRLGKQKAEQKFLITLSDGKLAESTKHPKEKYDLGKMINKILSESDIHVIDLGIGKESKKAATYYPHSISDINAKEMAEKLAGLITEVIAHS